MKVPWSKRTHDKPLEIFHRGEAAQGGADGDGKVHDLQYWMDSGLLTLPPGEIARINSEVEAGKARP